MAVLAKLTTAYYLFSLLEKTFPSNEIREIVEDFKTRMCNLVQELKEKHNRQKTVSADHNKELSRASI